jgi:hypothetical protein
MLQLQRNFRSDSIVLDLPSCDLQPSFGRYGADLMCIISPLRTLKPFRTRLTCFQAVSLGQEQSEKLETNQVARVKIFQLTEWVYKFLASATVPGPSKATVSGSEVMDLYRNCLDWYDGFLSLSEVHGNSSAPVLFVQ